MRLFLRITLAISALVSGFGVYAFFNTLGAVALIWPLVEARMLSDPFVGVTTDGEVKPNLFAIAPTGVDTAPLRNAADAFLDGPKDAQRSKIMFPVDDDEWRKWANIHLSPRQGVSLMEMTDAQKTLAFNLMRAGLSARGFKTSRDIMRLEGHLANLMDDHVQYGEERYWFTLMGEPSATEPWGWQLEGHHLIVNFFVLGDQVVMTPTFMGSEPPFAHEGEYAGTVILEQETEMALDFVNLLDDAQRSAAILSPEKKANNNYGELFSDNEIVPVEGLRLRDLDPAQRDAAVALIELYVNNMTAHHAAVRMVEVLAHWEDTFFAWVGPTDEDAVFYYRIQSPVIMIEFDHQTPIALDGPNLPSRNHIHTVVRTPNGNDYGKDLLRQHLAQHAH
jgi:hypothetical protein